jgi:uncharacterized protein
VRVVLDTNVLISGLRNKDRVCAHIVDLVVQGSLEAVYSTGILVEYRDVLQRPKLKLDPADVDAWLHLVEQDGHLVHPRPHPPLKDKSDTKFLEAALDSGASVLVTGNLRDFPASPYRGLKILRPADFLTAWLKGSA